MFLSHLSGEEDDIGEQGKLGFFLSHLSGEEDVNSSVELKT